MNYLNDLLKDLGSNSTPSQSITLTSGKDPGGIDITRKDSITAAAPGANRSAAEAPVAMVTMYHPSGGTISVTQAEVPLYTKQGYSTSPQQDPGYFTGDIGGPGNDLPVQAPPVVEEVVQPGSQNPRSVVNNPPGIDTTVPPPGVNPIGNTTPGVNTMVQPGQPVVTGPNGTGTTVQGPNPGSTWAWDPDTQMYTDPNTGAKYSADGTPEVVTHTTPGIAAGEKDVVSTADEIEELAILEFESDSEINTVEEADANLDTVVSNTTDSEGLNAITTIDDALNEIELDTTTTPEEKKGLAGSLLDSIKGIFKDGELAKAALLYAGSRIAGFNSAGSAKFAYGATDLFGDKETAAKPIGTFKSTKDGQVFNTTTGEFVNGAASGDYGNGYNSSNTVSVTNKDGSISLFPAPNGVTYNNGKVVYKSAGFEAQDKEASKNLVAQSDAVEGAQQSIATYDKWIARFDAEVNNDDGSQTPGTGWLAPFAGNIYETDLQQEFNAEQRDMVYATLRAKLGAQFTEKEAERLMATYPNLGMDEATVLQQLKRRRQEAMEVIANIQSKQAYQSRYGTLIGWKASSSNLHGGGNTADTDAEDEDDDKYL